MMPSPIARLGHCRLWLSLAAALLAPACQGPLPNVPPPAAVVDAKPIADKPRPSAAVTAHPLATRAALQMLASGGSALDATIAAQMVLGLVEPQSSGIGGGSLMLVWDGTAKRLRSYDGLARAPARTTASLRTDHDGRLLPLDEVARGGRSVGVPGTLAVMELAHRHHGRLPWARLFEPAIELAANGYPMAPYAHSLLERDPGAREHAEFREALFAADGKPHPVGTRLRNTEYAAALRTIATRGVDGWWRSGAAARLVAAAQRGRHASTLTVDDVLAYRAVEREPLCAAVRADRVCTMGPPSFGGIVVLQMLQMLAPAAGAAPPSLDDAAFWHRYAEAGRLAQADRRHWVGDPDHVAVPAATLVSPLYLRQRAAAIDPARAAPRVAPGAPVPPPVSAIGTPGADGTADATSQIVVADAAGNVVSTTTTINLNFGSRLRVDGYVLNNALTNFGPAPEAGQRAANAMAPHKRPVTSMAPTIVFDAEGKPRVAGGSAGGGPIVDYIARNLIELLWLDRAPAAALAGAHVTTAQAPRVGLEAGTPRAALAAALRGRGHDAAVEATPSGAGFLKRSAGGWLGAADPRRDGVALGL